jgi:hypothetical protein
VQAYRDAELRVFHGRAGSASMFKLTPPAMIASVAAQIGLTLARRWL